MSKIYAIIGLLVLFILAFEFAPASASSSDIVAAYNSTQSIQTSKIPLKNARDMEAQLKAEKEGLVGGKLLISFPIVPVPSTLTLVETASFGKPYLSGQIHTGTDISYNGSSDGSPKSTIVSSINGTVVQVNTEPSGAFGVNVQIQDSITNWVFTFAHLTEGSIPDGLKKGTEVARGDMLGVMGNTGNSTGSHLHVGISAPGLNLGNDVPSRIQGMIGLFDATHFIFDKKSMPDNMEYINGDDKNVITK